MKLLSFPAKQPETNPVQGIIELLENALERAKSGEIQAVFFVGVTIDGVALSAWNDSQTADAACNPYIMLGAVTYALHEYQNGMDDK